MAAAHDPSADNIGTITDGKEDALIAKTIESGLSRDPKGRQQVRAAAVGPSERKAAVTADVTASPDLLDHGCLE